jgi:hypothetical protein
MRASLVRLNQWQWLSLYPRSPGLKPASLLGIFGATEEAAEKARMKNDFGERWIGRG